MGNVRLSTNMGILILWVAFVNCETALYVQKLYCVVHDPVAAQNVSCWLKPFNRTTTLINVRFNITQKMNNVFVHGELYKKAEIIYRHFLVNKTVNYCDLMTKKVSTAYTRFFTPLYMPFSNLNHTCPYYGPAYIKDLIADKNRLSIWPLGSFRLDLLISNGRAKILTIQTFFTLADERRA